MSHETDTVSIGLDIGGTQIKAIALRPPLDILSEAEFPSRANEGPSAVREAVRQAIQYFQSNRIPFHAIGIGCAGSVNHQTGVVRNSPNFSHWNDIPLREWIQQDFALPVQIDNDAKCATLAEWKVGAGKGFSHLVLLTLGTGIGGGLVLDGKLYRGTTGTAGELGHVSIHTDGIECPCGNRGCFERYCSASAVVIKSKGISCKEVFEGASHHPDYKKIVDQFISDLEVALVGIANTFDPECILLGGAVSGGLVPHLAGIGTSVQKHCFPAVAAQLQIKPTQFGNLSGAIGAACLVWRVYLTSIPVRLQRTCWRDNHSGP